MAQSHSHACVPIVFTESSDFSDASPSRAQFLAALEGARRGLVYWCVGVRLPSRLAYELRFSAHDIALDGMPDMQAKAVFILCPDKVDEELSSANISRFYRMMRSIHARIAANDFSMIHVRGEEQCLDWETMTCTCGGRCTHGPHMDVGRRMAGWDFEMLRYAYTEVHDDETKLKSNLAIMPPVSPVDVYAFFSELDSISSRAAYRCTGTIGFEDGDLGSLEFWSFERREVAAELLGATSSGLQPRLKIISFFVRVFTAISSRASRKALRLRLKALEHDGLPSCPHSCNLVASLMREHIAAGAPVNIFGYKIGPDGCARLPAEENRRASSTDHVTGEDLGPEEGVVYC